MTERLRVVVAVASGAEADFVRALETDGGFEVISRCADVAELLALAAGGRADAAFVCADFRGLDRGVVARVRAAGLAVVGVLTTPVEDSRRRLVSIGVPEVVEQAPRPGSVGEALEADRDGRRRAATWLADPAADLERPADGSGLDAAGSLSAGAGLAGHPAHRPRAGRLVAVWGPAGAPGRTTVAVTLASEIACDPRRSAMIADADTYAASVAQTLGVLDEAPGLAAACRAAASGGLDVVGLARLAPLVGPRLRVLTGITRSDRWPELGGDSLPHVLACARELVEVTVVDCGFCLEQDEELSYDTAAPRRNASTLVCLEEADAVVAVGSADPIGLQRLIRGLGELGEVLPEVRPEVVVTKVRASSVGSDPARRVREALRRYAGVEQVHLVPDERDVLDAALLAGRSVVELSPGSQVRAAIAALASVLSPPLNPPGS